MNKKKPDQNRSVLDLSFKEAKDFFIKHESYCNFDLPPYIKFNTILQNISNFLKDKIIDSYFEKCPKDIDSVNHTILHNKDGKYAWRPLQLIHPALYISLVHKITEEKNWGKIKNRFKEFQKINKYIECTSIPVISYKNTSPKDKQILHWWEEVEQESIKMALSYDYLTHTDISNCYGSLYTHSISWALYGKEEAKKHKKNKKLIGNIIDSHLRDMSYGQTNGIPQGSVLMDFIAEMVLGYIDTRLIEEINKETDKKIEDFYIIRYRDDYRIFTNSLIDGEQIIKYLSEILIDFGMTLNPNKTKPVSQIIQGSIKPDKLYWIRNKQGDRNLQKHLLIIHDLSIKFPNKGSLEKVLTQFFDRIEKKKKFQNVDQLISIIIDIAYHNPRTYPVSSAIISKLINDMGYKDKEKIILKIIKKFKKRPNTRYLDIWLQRAVIGFEENLDEVIKFSEKPICELVFGIDSCNLWNSEWIKKGALKDKIDERLIIDKDELKKVRGKSIKRKEFSIFDRYY